MFICISGLVLAVKWSRCFISFWHSFGKENWGTPQLRHFEKHTREVKETRCAREDKRRVTENWKYSGWCWKRPKLYDRRLARGKDGLGLKSRFTPLSMRWRIWTSQQVEKEQLSLLQHNRESLGRGLHLHYTGFHPTAYVLQNYIWSCRAGAAHRTPSKAFSATGKRLRPFHVAVLRYTDKMKVLTNAEAVGSPSKWSVFGISEGYANRTEQWREKPVPYRKVF